MKRVLVIALIAVAGAWAQDDPAPPAWLSYERGMQAFRAGEYGQALLQFRTALERQPVYPEATAGIARVYVLDGNFELAEIYFREAIDRWPQLDVPEERYAIMYELADLYAVRGRHKSYIDLLESILADHDLSDDPEEDARLEAAYLRTIREAGIDRLLTLYRLPLDFATRAHARAGIFYLRTGRYNDAVFHLSIAALQYLTAMVSHIRTGDIDYAYTNLSVLLERASADGRLRSFAVESSVFAVLHYLGTALHFDGHAQRAADLWRALAALPAAGQYQRLSTLQLESPEPEPLIEY